MMFGWFSTNFARDRRAHTKKWWTCRDAVSRAQRLTRKVVPDPGLENPARGERQALLPYSFVVFENVTSSALAKFL